MLVGAYFPLSVAPGIITELRRILQLRFSNASAIAAQSGIVFERRPGDWVMAMTKPQEPTKAHDGIEHPAADFLDHEMVDLAYLLVTGSENGSTLNIVAGN